MRKHTASGGKKMASTTSTALEAAFSVAMMLLPGDGLFCVSLDGLAKRFPLSLKNFFFFFFFFSSPFP